MYKKTYFFILVVYLSLIWTCFSTKTTQLNETTTELLSNNSVSLWERLSDTFVSIISVLLVLFLVGKFIVRKPSLQGEGGQ